MSWFRRGFGWTLGRLAANLVAFLIVLLVIILLASIK